MFLVLVVLYKKSLAESETLNGLVQSSQILRNMNADVYVWDNSPIPFLSKADQNVLNDKFNFTYKNCNENLPLSQVYNKAIDMVMKNDIYHYLILLDHDSNISPAYFTELNSITTSNNSIDIILPWAKSNNNYISPAKLFWVRGNYFKVTQYGKYKKKLLAINSGMVLSKFFLQRTNFKYDQRLLSYGTDNYLMNVANKKNAVYYLMHYQFNHGYSFYDLENNNQRVEVFKQIKEANKIAFSVDAVQRLLISLYNIIASIKNSIKYKSVKFWER